jgi:hypothetical protein
MIAEKVKGVYRGERIRSLVDEYAEGQAEMARLHDGDALSEVAWLVLSELPEGPISLLASTSEGIALAAACAAIRDDVTDWQRIRYDRSTTVAHMPIVVEPVDGGEGWRDAVLGLYPTARFVVPSLVDSSV